MTRFPLDPPNDDTRDECLSALYRRGATAEPSAHVDAVIRAAARAALDEGSVPATRRHSSPWVSWAMAATVFLSVSLVWLLRDREAGDTAPAVAERAAPATMLAQNTLEAVPESREKFTATAVAGVTPPVADTVGQLALTSPPSEAEAIPPAAPPLAKAKADQMPTAPSRAEKTETKASPSLAEAPVAAVGTARSLEVMPLDPVATLHRVSADIQRHADIAKIVDALYQQLRPRARITDPALTAALVDERVRRYVAEKYAPALIQNYAQIYGEMVATKKNFSACEHPQPFDETADVLKALCVIEGADSLRVQYLVNGYTRGWRTTAEFVFSADGEWLQAIVIPLEEGAAVFVEGI